MAKVITKRSFQAHSVKDIGKFLPKAFKLARTGRPGPVHIDVPYDLWVTKADVEVPRARGALGDAQLAHARLARGRREGARAAARRPPAPDPRRRRRHLLRGERASSLRFAEHVNVPVYSTFMGKGALSARHPLHLGIAGCWGEYPAQEAARNADVILALGCRFSDIHTSSWLPGYTYNIPPTSSSTSTSTRRRSAATTRPSSASSATPARC